MFRLRILARLRVGIVDRPATDAAAAPLPVRQAHATLGTLFLVVLADVYQVRALTDDRHDFVQLVSPHVERNLDGLEALQRRLVGHFYRLPETDDVWKLRECTSLNFDCCYVCYVTI